MCSPQTHIQAEAHTLARAHRELSERQCKIRGAVNGGGQLGCCFIKVQRKCRSVSCRMRGIGSASFCLLHLKHTPAGIRQPLPPNAGSLMVIRGKYLLSVSQVLMCPSGAQTCPPARLLYLAARDVATFGGFCFPSFDRLKRFSPGRVWSLVYDQSNEMR